MTALMEGVSQIDRQGRFSDASLDAVTGNDLHESTDSQASGKATCELATESHMKVGEERRVFKKWGFQLANHHRANRLPPQPQGSETDIQSRRDERGWIGGQTDSD